MNSLISKAFRPHAAYLDGLYSYCRECEKLCKKEYYYRHKDRILAQNKTPEVSNRRSEYQKVWQVANRSKVVGYARMQKAKRKGAEGYCSPSQLKSRIEYYGAQCWICAVPYEQIDHVKPIAKGGSNWPGNLRPICRLCNIRKRATWPFNKQEFLLAYSPK